LDLSFGNNGFANTGIESNGQVLVQNDQTIYVVLHYNDQTLITHILSNGTVDSSYGTNGISVSVPFGGLQGAIQGDGKIVVAGGLHLFRFNTDGSLDETFPAQSPDIGIASVAIQQDGKIVLGGSKGSDFAVARYNTDGTPDLTFSEDGKQTTDFGNFDLGRSVAIQSDGKIVLAGYTQNQDNSVVDFALARYNTDGTPDITFSGDGKLTTDFTSARDFAMSVAIQGDEKIVATGIIYSNSIFFPFNLTFALARYNTDGSLDNTFSGDGKQTTEFEIDPDDRPVQIHGIIQNNGKIVVTGFYTIARYNTDGSLDATFSADGKQFVDFEISSSAIQNGKLVVAGEAIARYFLDDKEGFPKVRINSPVDGATYTANAVVLLSAEAADPGGKVKSVAFYNGDKLIFTEVWPPFYRKWYNVKQGSYTITAKATDNDGNVTISAPIRITVLPNHVATVNITSPGDGTIFSAPADIYLRADAVVPNGSISKVDFYEGNNLVLTEYKAPYYNKWGNVPAGNYSIVAKATDGNGNVITSQPVHVTVTGPLARSIVRADKQSSLQQLLSLKLNPNPVADVLNISIDGLQPNGKSSIAIISVSGVVIRTVQSNAVNKNMKFDVSSLSAGVYFIKVVNGDKILYKQFVKL
jgi:uncharacterized delta-60 repeat protein